METCFCYFFDNNLLTSLLRSVSHMLHVSSSRMCALTNGVQQLVRSAPSVFPGRKAKVVSPSYAQMYHLREFLEYWWLFRMLYVLHFGARLAEEERKKEDE